MPPSLEATTEKTESSDVAGSSCVPLRTAYAVLGILSLLFIASLFRAGAAIQDPPSQVAAAAAISLTPPPISARSALVQKVGGEILFEHQADAQLPIASITKIALAIIAADVLDPNALIVVSDAAARLGEGDLTPGAQWRARNLIAVTLVDSSNVGAEALAEAASDALGVIDRIERDLSPRERIVRRMNMLAQNLRLSRTYFVNPSGLDIGDKQPGAMSSARDVATLAAYAAEKYENVFSVTKGDVFVGPERASTEHIQNTNPLLTEIPGVVMGKTGFTDLSGGNLVMVFEVAGERYVAVVLGSTFDGRFVDMRELIQTVKAAAGKQQML